MLDGVEASHPRHIVGCTLRPQIRHCGRRIVEHPSGVGPRIMIETNTSDRIRSRKDQLAGKRILIVDDEADARELLRYLLESYDVQVSDADSVDDALALIQSRQFDLLVSDIGMPAQDGYALISAVRALPHGSALPALAFTAFTRPEDRERALSAGFDLHVGKLSRVETLLDALVQLLTGDAAPPLRR